MIVSVGNEHKDEIVERRANLDSLGLLLITGGAGLLALSVLLAVLGYDAKSGMMGASYRAAATTAGFGVLLFAIGAAMKYTASRPVASLRNTDTAPDQN